MRTDTTLSITFGIVIGLLASFVQSLGLTIQRKSHVLNQSLPEHRQRVEHKRPLWLLGFAIFISSNVIGSFVQIASLPVVILAPLGAVSLLWNAFFARLLLGDVFSPWMILGTILIAGGAILIAFFGIVPEQTRSLEDLLALFRRPAFIAYFSVLGFIVVCCLIITHLTEFSLIRFMKQSSLPISPASSAIDLPTHSTNTTDVHSNTLDLPPTERTPLVDSKPQTPFQSPNALRGDQSNDPTVRSITRTRLLLAVSYASFSGIISGMCLLFAKSGVELLLLTLAGKNQFWRWEAWMLVLGLIVFALLQLWYLHKALTLADPTLVCPSAFCFYNLSSIVNGLVYFNQFSLIPPLHLGLVVLGIIVLLGGVWVVSIQSGGGGIDVGTWSEEPVILAGEDVALYPEEQRGEDRALPSDEAPVVSQPGTRSTFGAVPMERGTVSEGSLPNITSLATDLDLEQSRSTFTSPNKRPRLSSQLYSSPRTPSSRRVSQRPSADLQSSTSTISLTQGHPRNVSFPAPSYSHAPLSPGLGTVSTLGPGFQIGLSPLSPGFTIMPVERRGRPTFADIAQGVVSDVQQRRRTVSEGQLLPRVRDDVFDEAALPDPPALDVGHSHRHPAPDNNGKAKTRWQWLRGVINRKD